MADTAEPETEPEDADVCAGFQRVVVESLVKKTVRAAKSEHKEWVGSGAGGVAANSELRRTALEACATAGLSLSVPPLEELHRQCGDDCLRRRAAVSAGRDETTCRSRLDANRLAARHAQGGGAEGVMTVRPGHPRTRAPPGSPGAARHFDREGYLDLEDALSPSRGRRVPRGNRARRNRRIQVTKRPVLRTGERGRARSEDDRAHRPSSSRGVCLRPLRRAAQAPPISRSSFVPTGPTTTAGIPTDRERCPMVFSPELPLQIKIGYWLTDLPKNEMGDLVSCHAATTINTSRNTILTTASPGKRSSVLAGGR